MLSEQKLMFRKDPTVSHLYERLFVSIQFYKPLFKVFHPFEAQQNKRALHVSNQTITQTRSITDNDANPQGVVHPGAKVLSTATNPS